MIHKGSTDSLKLNTLRHLFNVRVGLRDRVHDKKEITILEFGSGIFGSDLFGIAKYFFDRFTGKRIHIVGVEKEGKPTDETLEEEGIKVRRLLGFGLEDQDSAKRLIDVTGLEAFDLIIAFNPFAPTSITAEGLAIIGMLETMEFMKRKIRETRATIPKALDDLPEEIAYRELVNMLGCAYIQAPFGIAFPTLLTESGLLFVGSTGTIGIDYMNEMIRRLGYALLLEEKQEALSERDIIKENEDGYVVIAEKGSQFGQ